MIKVGILHVRSTHHLCTCWFTGPKRIQTPHHHPFSPPLPTLNPTSSYCYSYWPLMMSSIHNQKMTDRFEFTHLVGGVIRITLIAGENEVGFIEGVPIIWVVNVYDQYRNMGYATRLVRIFRKYFPGQVRGALTSDDNFAMQAVLRKEGFVIDTTIRSEEGEVYYHDPRIGCRTEKDE